MSGGGERSTTNQKGGKKDNLKNVDAAKLERLTEQEPRFGRGDDELGKMTSHRSEEVGSTLQALPLRLLAKHV